MFCTGTSPRTYRPQAVFKYHITLRTPPDTDSALSLYLTGATCIDPMCLFRVTCYIKISYRPQRYQTGSITQPVARSSGTLLESVSFGFPLRLSKTRYSPYTYRLPHFKDRLASILVSYSRFISGAPLFQAVSRGIFY